MHNFSATNKIQKEQMNATRTLEVQRKEFSQRKFLATPLSGLIAWLLIGIASFFFDESALVWILFIGTGSIVYLALFVSKFTGENYLDKSKPKNEFDSLFMFTVAQSVMVYAIAIPFFLIDYTSLPLSIGILTGTMWIPFSWIVKHWVGIFHTVVRTIAIVLLFYLFPEDRFTYISFAIVGVYVITLLILNKRHKIVNS